jgi:hypothetical protein
MKLTIDSYVSLDHRCVTESPIEFKVEEGLVQLENII